MIPLWILAAAGWFVIAWFLAVGLGRFFSPRLVGQGAPRWVPNAPDPMFRDDALAEDEQWAGVESEWHAFVDSFGVREAS
jgi:hypothetical protein